MKMSKAEEIWTQLRQDWPLYALLGVVVVLTAALYGKIPDEVPIHWNWRGEPDGFASKSVAVALMPLTAIATHLLTVALISVDPRRERDDQPQSTLRLFRMATPTFLLGLHVVMLAAWLGLSINLTSLVLAGCGVLFAVLGNAMGRIKPNYFVGFRLPWTLENDVVWKKTHRFAGKLWFLGGAALVFTPFLPGAFQIVYFLAVTAVLTIAPMVFAYREYHRLA